MLYLIEDMKYDYEQRSLALIQLDDAIKNSEIKVFYQPIYDAKTKQIASAEGSWYAGFHPKA